MKRRTAANPSPTNAPLFVVVLVAACSNEPATPPASVALTGVWSNWRTSRDDTAWRIEDVVCSGCPLAQYRHLQALLADQSNEQRSLTDLDEEASRIGNEHRQGLMTEAQRARLAQYVPGADAATRCEPPHLWQLVLAPLPLSIESRDGSVVLHQHHWNVVRAIGLDGRAAGAPVAGTEPTSARFEGRTLVVETRNVAALTIPGLSIADGARIIERYTPDASGRRLEIELTLVEPTSFREPLVVRDARVRTPDVELFDYDPCGSPFAH